MSRIVQLMLCLALVGAAFVCANALAVGRGVVLTEDIGVSFSAMPTENLVPGDSIEFELTATNHGDEAVDTVTLSSSDYVDEIVRVGSDCTLITVVADGEDFFFYYLNWYLAGAGGPPLEAGESRTCHFQMTLTPAAPAVYDFTFGLPTYYFDPNPSNDRVTVTLQRGDLAPVAVPSLSAYAMLLLVATLAIAACFGFRSFERHA